MKSDETRFNSTAPFRSVKSENNPQEEKAQASASSPEWRKMGAAGVAGLALGAAGMVLTSSVIPQNESVVEDDDEWDDEIVEQDAEVDDELPATIGDVAVAHGVTDDMDFAHAFAAARAEVGAGGCFEWRGTVYGTYTEAEWNGMSADERQAYYDGFHNGLGHSTSHSTSHSTAQHQDTQDDDNHDQPEHEVEVHAITQDSDGRSIVAITYDGHEAYYLDTDGDGYVDIRVADLNDNGELDENETELVDEQISVADLARDNDVDVQYVDSFYDEEPQDDPGWTTDVPDEPLDPDMSEDPDDPGVDIDEPAWEEPSYGDIVGDEDLDIDITDDQALDI